MQQKYLLIFLFSAIINTGFKTPESYWAKEKHKDYSLFYTSTDRYNKKEYIKLIENGVNSVKLFFNTSYKNTFDIILHPNRHSLDSAWQKYLNMPDLKSECWMVASGDATKLDMISPKLWDSLSCEHKYRDKVKTQQLITHELFHVIHGQFNTSPDFSNTEGIDWFVEGLATFASGQCDSLRIKEVKKAIADNKIPKSLNDFWTGKLKYGLSGSVVMYLDYKYGRIKLKTLLPFNNKTDLLLTLNTTETELVEGWKNYMKAL